MNIIKALLISLLLFGISVPSIAASTTKDLYRLGNASGAKMENVRAGKDAEVFEDEQGVKWHLITHKSCNAL